MASEKKMEELENLVLESNKAVVLVGFSAGANLVFHVARRLLKIGCKTPFAILAMGHTVFADDRMDDTTIPGIIILGENELQIAPQVEDLSNGQTSYADLSEFPGGILPEDVGAMEKGWLCSTSE